MLEQHESDGFRLGVALVTLARGRAARCQTPTPDGDGCRHQRVKLAAELKFYEPVEVIHLY